VYIKVRTGCSEIDLYDTYKAALSGNSSAWVVIDKSTGTSVVLGSISYNDVTKVFGLPLLAGSYLVSLAEVSVLESNGIVGYESNRIDVTMA